MGKWLLLFLLHLFSTRRWPMQSKKIQELQKQKKMAILMQMTVSLLVFKLIPYNSKKNIFYFSPSLQWEGTHFFHFIYLKNFKQIWQFFFQKLSHKIHELIKLLLVHCNIYKHKHSLIMQSLLQDLDFLSFISTLLTHPFCSCSYWKYFYLILSKMQIVLYYMCALVINRNIGICNYKQNTDVTRFIEDCNKLKSTDHLLLLSHLVYRNMLLFWTISKLTLNYFLNRISKCLNSEVNLNC